MKKKMLECTIHGLSLFRCKKRCWRGGSKEKPYTCIYTETCFKCVSERRTSMTLAAVKERNRQVNVRIG